MSTTITARVDIQLARGQNNREHHRVRAARVAAERKATRLALAAGDWRGDPVSLRRAELGARVTIVRPFVTTPLDGDNLSAACKAVRDEVAAFLGVDDASARLHWIYLQSPAVVTGKSTKPGRTRPSTDHDTRPLVRIEVLPVGDIDPQAQALAQAEAREWALGVQVAAQAHRLRLAEAVVEAARDWRECGCEHPACNFCIDDADTAAALAAWDAVPGDVGPVDLG
jgi:hypothetical protein